MSVPSVQQALVLHLDYGSQYTIEESWPIRKPGPGDAIVKIEASGICQGDVFARDGGLPAPLKAVRPLIGGHEGVGIVVALGDGASAGHVKIGDRVGLGWRHSVCWHCEECSAGRDNQCNEQVVSGIETDGTFQQYLTVAAVSLVPVPVSSSSKASSAELAPLLCGGATALAAFRATKAKAGDWVAVAGAGGGVGHLAVKYAKHFGCRVVAIDATLKEDFCRQLGIDVFVTFEDADMVKRINDATSGGVSGAVICSPVGSAYQAAIQYSRSKGIIVGVGPTVASIHTGLLMARNVCLAGQRNGSYQDIKDAIELAGEGIVPVIDVIKLEDIDKALDQFKQGVSSGRRVIVF